MNNFAELSIGCVLIIVIFPDVSPVFPRCFPGVYNNSCERAAVRRRFAENAAHFAVRDALQAVRGPATLLTCTSTHSHDARLGCRVRRKHIL